MKNIFERIANRYRTGITESNGIVTIEKSLSKRQRELVAKALLKNVPWAWAVNFGVDGWVYTRNTLARK